MRIVVGDSAFEQSDPPTNPAGEHVPDADGNGSEGDHLPPTSLRRHAYRLEQTDKSSLHITKENLCAGLWLSHPSSRS